MNKSFLEIADYPDVRRRIEEVFHADRFLPDYVFRKRFRFTLLQDFDLGFDVPKILRDGRFCSKHETTLLSVLDPDPISHFYKRFGKINSFKFQTNISDEDYVALTFFNEHDELVTSIAHSNNVVWIPERADWAMWGDRDREITVIGFDDPAMADFLISEVGYWFDAETALRVFASNPYKDQKAPEDFARPLVENYGSRAGLERKLKDAGFSLPETYPPA